MENKRKCRLRFPPLFWSPTFLCDCSQITAVRASITIRKRLFRIYLPYPGKVSPKLTERAIVELWTNCAQHVAPCTLAHILSNLYFFILCHIFCVPPQSHFSYCRHRILIVISFHSHSLLPLLQTL